jgi:hypothetical protein
MIKFSAHTATQLLLGAIRERRAEILAVCDRTPRWKWDRSEELRACHDQDWIRWRPSGLFETGLTRHQRNVAASAIRQMEKTGLVECIWHGPLRIYMVRLTPKGQSQADNVSRPA